MKMQKIPFPIPRHANRWFGLICDLNIPDYNPQITGGTDNIQYFYINYPHPNRKNQIQIK
jgi:hypothetical protein